MRISSFLPLVFAAVAFSVVPMGTAAHDQTSDDSRPALRLSGFTDVNFYAGDDTDPESTSGFRDGQFVLHMASKLSRSFDVFAEISLSARDSEYVVELERGVIKYSHNDYLKISVGRFHTPVNWWNNAFHHGAWLQTTIDRPAMTRFGGEFIPVHFVGGIVEGNIPSGTAHLAYAFGVGNGRSENTARGGDAGDVNNNRALLLKLYSRPAWPYRLEVGGAYYRDKVSTMGLEAFDEDLASLYAVWSGDLPEIVGEYARLSREGETSSRARSGFRHARPA